MELKEQVGYAYTDMDKGKTIGFGTLELALNYYEKEVFPRMEGGGKLQNTELLVCFYNVQVGTIDVNKLAAERRKHETTTTS